MSRRPAGKGAEDIRAAQRDVEKTRAKEQEKIAEEQRELEKARAKELNKANDLPRDTTPPTTVPPSNP